MNRYFRGLSVIRRRGVGYLCYLLGGYLMPRLGFAILDRLAKRPLRRIFFVSCVAITIVTIPVLYLLRHRPIVTLGIAIIPIAAILGRWAGGKLNLWLIRREARALYEKASATFTDETFTSLDELQLDRSTRDAIEAARRNSPDTELVIGRIDHDIRVLGLYGPLPILPSVTAADFLERPRFRLDVVLLDNKILVRKNFARDKVSFLNEWRNLGLLHGKANIPALYRVDEERLTLYKNLIVGRIVRDILLDAGARIMSVQTREESELNSLDRVSRLERVVARGTALIPSCLSEQFLREMEEQISLMHSCGLFGIVPTFGNIIVERKSGAPYFIDFDGARRHPYKSSPYFIFRRDQDRVKFNQRYGRNLVTEKSARAALDAQLSKLPGWYAPVDFGNGLSVGGFWSTDSGMGRWEFFNHKIMTPVVAGKRVLDLGSNNGVIPMMMLRAGAREVIGVELSPLNVESAQLVHRLFEWRDMRRYSLHIHNANMLDIVDADWGSFDVVTALCSLYYLEPDEMAKIVRRASELAPVMVVQANAATRREAAAAKSVKSSTSFLKDLLELNGFPEVQVFTPPGFSRPLLVGTSRSRCIDVEEEVHAELQIA